MTYDEALLAELVSLRFIEAHRHVAIVGPVGVGKTFVAHALGHIACRRGYPTLVLRGDRLLKMLKHARLDHSYEAELRKLVGIDVLIIDDFCLDAMDAAESRDIHEILTERDRAGSVIVTSNRGPDEARHLRRSGTRPGRHRSLHLQCVRPRHRRRVLSKASQADIPRPENWTQEGLI